MTADVRFIYPDGSVPAPLRAALEAAGLADTPCSDRPAIVGPEGAVYLAAPEWASELPGLLTASSPAVAVAFGEAPDLPVPVLALPQDASVDALAAILAAAAETARTRARANTAEERISALNAIGIALSAERDLDRLLELILTESRRFTGSEAGSLYLLEESEGVPHLRFKLAQNDALDLEFTERTLPISDASLAGFVAGHGETIHLDDAYAIPEDRPYQHNTAFDEMTGWRTRAMLVVPMFDHEEEIVGVLQLMNPRLPDGTHITYPADLVPLLHSLATQAAVSIKANRLTLAMKSLFEDFASAAVTAVELRDPTTAGHSHRVASLSVALTEIVDRVSDGPYAGVTFTRDDIREIQTAALLHDFGKIGVPERVLVKAKKLEDYELLRIRERFDYALEAQDAYEYRAFLQELAESGRVPTADDLRMLDAVRDTRAEELEDMFAEVMRANEPSVLSEESGSALQHLLDRNYTDRRGQQAKLLHGPEFELLSIPRGSLSTEERLQIESHVTHTFTFLSKVPWTPDLARVPQIAAAHHEKLDGRGYPYGLGADEIPVGSKIMSICDIFDALTASDRPYKKAVPLDKSLQILEEEATRGILDTDLVQAFIGAGTWGVLELS